MARHHGYGGVARQDRCLNPWNYALTTAPAADSLDLLSQYCSEFLVHAADVEGLCQGIDQELVTSTSIRALALRIPPFAKSEIELGEWVKVPTTYAGGAKGRLSFAL